ALAYKRKDDLANAIEALQKCLAAQPDFADARSTLGEIYLQQGKFDEAKSELSEAVKLKPKDAEFHYTLGNVLQRRGETDAAIAEFRAAIKLAPGNPEFHNSLGAALRQKGEPDAARAELQEAARLIKLKQDRDAAFTALSTGVQRLNEGKLDEAIERFGAAVKLDPNLAQAYYQLSVALKKKGQVAASQEALRKAERLDPRVKN
ncbi:MAG: tetratricopeptide repeat protein, partial [Blastocatellia bacterium]